MSACACGCGRPVVKPGRRYLHGHSGGKRKRVVGETKVNPHGYVEVFLPGHPEATSMGWALEHRVVMQDKLGRLLDAREVVHHKNGIRHDNRADNLELLPGVGTHTRMHAQASTLWSRAYPELVGCVSCGRRDRKHFADGLCRPCWNDRRRERRAAERPVYWSKRGQYMSCQRCGTTDQPHYGRGYCQVCYMHLFNKGELPSTSRTGSRKQNPSS